MNILDIYRQYGVTYRVEGHEHCRRGWVQTDCPYCSQHLRGHFRLGFNLAGKYFCCWACGPQRLTDTVMLLTGVAYHAARELLDGYEFVRPQKNKQQMSRGQVKLPPNVGPLQPAHEAYLRRRLMKPDKLVKDWGIGGIGISANLAWRIFIPIHFDNEIVSWTTRAITDQTRLRYVTADADSEKYSCKLLLYGEDFARDAIIVVEGPMDAWRIGFGAVATLGTAYSRAQLLRMSRFPKRFICFDVESAAQKRARKLCTELAAFPGTTTNIVLESAKDPGAAHVDELRQLKKLIA
jgi:hypothetical protein